MEGLSEQDIKNWISKNTNYCEERGAYISEKACRLRISKANDVRLLMHMYNTAVYDSVCAQCKKYKVGRNHIKKNQIQIIKDHSDEIKNLTASEACRKFKVSESVFYRATSMHNIEYKGAKAKDGFNGYSNEDWNGFALSIGCKDESDMWNRLRIKKQVAYTKIHELLMKKNFKAPGVNTIYSRYQKFKKGENNE